MAPITLYQEIYINFFELAPAHMSSYELVQVKKVEKVKKVKKEATFHQKLSLAKFPKSNQVRKCTKRLQKQTKFLLISVNKHQLFHFSTFLLGKVKKVKKFM